MCSNALWLFLELDESISEKDALCLSFDENVPFKTHFDEELDGIGSRFGPPDGGLKKSLPLISLFKLFKLFLFAEYNIPFDQFISKMESKSLKERRNTQRVFRFFESIFGG